MKLRGGLHVGDCRFKEDDQIVHHEICHSGDDGDRQAHSDQRYQQCGRYSGTDCHHCTFIAGKK